MLDLGPDPLDELFANGPPEPRKSTDDLNYAQMLAIAGLFERWAATETKITAEQRQRLLTMAQEFRDEAAEFGPNWNPPEPEKVGLFLFMAREEMASW